MEQIFLKWFTLSGSILKKLHVSLLNSVIIADNELFMSARLVTTKISIRCIQPLVCSKKGTSSSQRRRQDFGSGEHIMGVGLLRGPTQKFDKENWYNCILSIFFKKFNKPRVTFIAQLDKNTNRWESLRNSQKLS